MCIDCHVDKCPSFSRGFYSFSKTVRVFFCLCSYVVEASFIDGVNRSTRRKQPTCRASH